MRPTGTRRLWPVVAIVLAGAVGFAAGALLVDDSGPTDENCTAVDAAATAVSARMEAAIAAWKEADPGYDLDPVGGSGDKIRAADAARAAVRLYYRLVVQNPGCFPAELRATAAEYLDG